MQEYDSKYFKYDSTKLNETKVKIDFSAMLKRDFIM